MSESTQEERLIASENAFIYVYVYDVLHYKMYRIFCLQFILQ